MSCLAVPAEPCLVRILRAPLCFRKASPRDRLLRAPSLQGEELRVDLDLPQPLV